MYLLYTEELHYLGAEFFWVFHSGSLPRLNKDEMAQELNFSDTSICLVRQTSEMIPR